MPEPVALPAAGSRLFADCLVLLRGGGDLATGVAYRLQRAGFPLLVLELARPLVVRRRVALATAVLEGSVDVEGLRGQRIEGVAEAAAVRAAGAVPVLVAPQLPEVAARVIVDARMAKRNIDTDLAQAPLVVALGPGFTAGADCHAVVETMRGHWLGRVIWDGSALPDTGRPGIVGGKGAERVLRAPVAGVARWQVAIGERVAAGQPLGSIGDQTLYAPFAGVLRGAVAPGTAVPAGLKIGDVDARADPAACVTISDKALAIGGGVLEAILTHLKETA